MHFKGLSVLDGFTIIAFTIHIIKISAYKTNGTNFTHSDVKSKVWHLVAHQFVFSALGKVHVIMWIMSNYGVFSRTQFQWVRGRRYGILPTT